MPARGREMMRNGSGAAARLARALALAACLALVWALPLAHAQRIVRVGVILDGPWYRNAAVLAQFKEEILTLTKGEFDVRFEARHTLTADWSVRGVDRAIDRLMGEPSVDLVLAFGILAGNQVARRTSLGKPVIAPFVLDPKLQNLPAKGKSSGLQNLAYVTIYPLVERDLTVFHQLIPFKRLTFLRPAPLADVLPGLQPLLLQLGLRMKVTVDVLDFGATADSVLNRISAASDAVYLMPLLQMSEAEQRKLIAGINEKKLPSFSLVGRNDVLMGAMAGLSPEAGNTLLNRLARRVALLVQRVLLGEDPATFSTDFRRPERLVINLYTALAVGFRPTWELLGEAEVIRPERAEAATVWSLEGALREAVRVNLDLAARAKAVRADQQNVARARSGLLPQLDLSATAVQIDEDRAAASLGSQAEKTATGALTLRQLIYGDAAWANFSNSKRLLQIARLDEEQLRLDVILDTTEAYLNVLRTSALELIEENNLALSRANLRIAKSRQTVGSGGPSEVFRWESEVAINRQSVAQARSQRQLAMLALNRILHRPLDERFDTEEVSLDDPALLISDPRLLQFTSDPWAFEVFEDFMVQEGLARAPELASLEQAIAAQQRTLSATGRAFWAPTIALQGEYSTRFSESGAGSEPAPVLGSLPQADDDDWSVTLSLTLPLLTGGARTAENEQAFEELTRLQLQREATAERVEQRIRAALTNTRASFPSIRFAKDAAAAAAKSLELVQEAYSRGVADIAELLEAQNAALASDQAASNALFSFLIDFFNVQRAVGQFDFFLEGDARERYFERLNGFFEEAGIEPLRPR